MALGVIVVIF